MPHVRVHCQHRLDLRAVEVGQHRYETTTLDFFRDDEFVEADDTEPHQCESQYAIDVGSGDAGQNVDDVTARGRREGPLRAWQAGETDTGMPNKIVRGARCPAAGQVPGSGADDPL